MHWLTKMLVLFVAVLSLLLSALTMAFAVNVDRIRLDYQAEKDRRTAAEASYGDQLARAQATAEGYDDQLAAARAETTNLKTGYNELVSANAKLVVGERRAEDALSSLNAKIGGLGESVRTLTDQNAAYREEVLSLREAEYGFRTREISLEDRINELEASQEVLQQDRRALLEMIAELRDTIANKDSGGIPGGKIIGPPIRGRVVEIKEDASTGRVYAQINVGTNDAVQANMRFSVLRDNKDFVGFITITEVDLQWAIGQFDDLDGGTMIQGGDMVLSRVD